MQVRLCASSPDPPRPPSTTLTLAIGSHLPAALLLPRRIVHSVARRRDRARVGAGCIRWWAVALDRVLVCCPHPYPLSVPHMSRLSALILAKPEPWRAALDATLGHTPRRDDTPLIRASHALRRLVAASHVALTCVSHAGQKVPTLKRDYNLPFHFFSSLA